jgi:ELWxxDGT repeat protein
MLVRLAPVEEKECVGPWHDCRITIKVLHENLGWDRHFEGTVFKGELYFTMDDGVHGSELWTTDGSSTRLLKDINPGSGNSYAQQFVNANDTLFFQAYSPTEISLWITDGTRNNTRPIECPDPCTYCCDSERGDYTGIIAPFRGKVILEGCEHLYITDGTVNGTNLLSDLKFQNHYDRVEYNGEIYFPGRDKLWATGGTASGTRVVDQIRKVEPRYLIVIDGKLVFVAKHHPQDYFYERVLWMSDSSGTRVFYLYDPDYARDLLGSYFFMTEFMDRGFFRLGNTLWFTDGTAGGTRMFLRVNGAPSGFSPVWHHLEWKLLFLTSDGLWTTCRLLLTTTSMVWVLMR